MTESLLHGEHIATTGDQPKPSGRRKHSYRQFHLAVPDALKRAHPEKSFRFVNDVKSQIHQYLELGWEIVPEELARPPIGGPKKGRPKTGNAPFTQVTTGKGPTDCFLMWIDKELAAEDQQYLFDRTQKKKEALHSGQPTQGSPNVQTYSPMNGSGQTGYSESIG